MKLNYKRVILVGFAFFLISSFWQAYDAIIPLILENKYHLTNSQRGFIMALDNILSLFMLPLFGSISDKTNTKFGKRTPYIFVGTILAVIFFVLATLVNELILFVIVLLLVLISMATFRSPAVALMPDVTIKPLRSKGNAIINLMGTFGGVIVLGLGVLFKTDTPFKTDFTFYTMAVCGLMLLALIIFLITVKEPKWAQEMLEDTEKFGIEEKEEDNSKVEFKKLSKGQFVSLLLILASVFLWYFGYNAVTSNWSIYASNVLKMSFNIALIVAQAFAVITYVPAGIIASKIGRRKTILIGITLLATAFGSAWFMNENSSPIICYALFGLAGIGWATINVNSFPMVVELSKEGNVGKYTGYYYTASMAAQSLTPWCVGFIMDIIGNMSPLFIYATIFVVGSFITMFFVKHGDSKPEQKKSLLENFDNDD